MLCPPTLTPGRQFLKEIPTPGGTLGFWFALLYPLYQNIPPITGL